MRDFLNFYWRQWTDKFLNMLDDMLKQINGWIP